MTLSHSPDTGGPASRVTDQWRAKSLATGWLCPGDWPARSASALVAAVLSGEQIEAASGALGAERSQQGVGLDEGLRDLAALFFSVGQVEPPFAAASRFSSSWVEVVTSTLLNAVTIDARTGLTTREYLVPRVRELYAEASVRGIQPNDERCLIVLDKPGAQAEMWRSSEREVTVGRVLRTVLDRGQTNSILPSGTFLSLVARDESLDENIVRIRRALSGTERAGAREQRVRIHPLPPTVAEAEELLLVL